MKKLLLALTTFLTFNSGFGQTNVYHSFPDTNAVWNEQNWYFPGGAPPQVYNPNICFLSGDTVISTVQYKKILTTGYRYAYSISNACCFYTNSYLGGLRQDTILKKVFFIPATSTNEQLLYDFNLHIGDTLPPSYVNGNNNYVSLIDSILIGISYRKQYHISLIGSTFGSDSNYVSLIEGIGSTFGLTAELSPPFEAGDQLNCFQQNGVSLWTRPQGSCDLTVGIREELSNKLSLIDVFPNPASMILNVQMNETRNMRFKIVNIIGEELISEEIKKPDFEIDVSVLPSGIYFLKITDGEKNYSKKVIVQH